MSFGRAGFHKKKKWVPNEFSLTLHCPCCQCCPYYLLTDQAFCWCTRSPWPASSNNKRRPQACRYPAWASKGNPRWALQKVWISKATSGFISLWSDDNLYLAPFKTVLRSEFEEKNTSSCLQAQHLLIPGRIRTTRATVAIRAEYTEFHDSHLALCFCSSRYSPCSTLHSLQGCCRRHAVGLDDKSSGEVWLPDNQTLKVCPFVRMFLKWKAWDYFRTGDNWITSCLMMFTCCGNRGLRSFTLVLYSWRSDQAALQMDYSLPTWWSSWKRDAKSICHHRPEKGDDADGGWWSLISWILGSAMVGVPSQESFLQDVSTCLEPQNILSQLSVHHHYSYYSSDFMLCLLRWLGDSWNFAESMTVVPQRPQCACRLSWWCLSDTLGSCFVEPCRTHDSWKVVCQRCLSNFCAVALQNKRLSGVDTKMWALLGSQGANSDSVHQMIWYWHHMSLIWYWHRI